MAAAKIARIDRLELIKCIMGGAVHRSPHDLKDAIILDKGIFLTILGRLEDKELVLLMKDQRLKPAPVKSDYLAIWMRVSRSILGLNQTLFGERADLSQKQVSLLETNANTDEGYSEEKLSTTVAKILAALTSQL